MEKTHTKIFIIFLQQYNNKLFHRKHYVFRFRYLYFFSTQYTTNILFHFFNFINCQTNLSFLSAPRIISFCTAMWQSFSNFIVTAFVTSRYNIQRIIVQSPPFIYIPPNYTLAAFRIFSFPSKVPQKFIRLSSIFFTINI